MEIRARYLLMGLFVTGVIVIGFLFTFWMNTTGGLGKRSEYLVVFDFPVPGLLTGSAVLFNGIRVGEVTELSLNASAPGQTIATIAVAEQTPIRADTYVGLDFRGLTGAPSISLAGGTSTAPAVLGGEGRKPVLIADSRAGQDVMTAARATLGKINTILDDNSAPLKSAIADIATFAAALARNSERIDKIAAGLAGAFGGEKVVPASYGLTPPSFPAVAKTPDGQIVLTEPTALIQFDTQRILVQQGQGVAPAFEEARWADNLPNLVQATVVRGFENAGLAKVSRESENISGGHQLLIDIREFTIVAGAQAKARVTLAAKLLDDAGELVESKVFTGEIDVPAMEAARAAAGLDKAFGTAAGEMISWALGAIAT